MPSGDNPKVSIETVTAAHDGSGDLIVRLYESKKASGTARVQFHFPVKCAYSCDMLEQKQEEIFVTNGVMELSFGAFEIKTIRMIPGK